LELAVADVLAATADLKSAQAVVGEREAGVPEALRSAEALAKEKQTAGRLVERLNVAMDAARRLAQEAAVAFSAAETSAAAAKAEAIAAREMETGRRTEFIARVKESGFDDYDAFKDAKLSDEQTIA
jgi:malonyl CoA-acyl carrier protein transacylase